MTLHLPYRHALDRLPLGIPARPAGRGLSFGTFGELVQGVIGGETFLITMPVDRYSRAEFQLENESSLSCPSGHWKTRTACERLLASLGLPLRGRISIESDLLHEKGMASSSADIIAACRAIGAYYGTDLEPAFLAKLAASVEPTDGVMYPGLNAFNQHAGRLIEPLGAASYEIIGVILDGGVGTVEYDSKSIRYSSDDKERFELAYRRAKRGLACGDIGLMGTASTISSRINQSRLEKPHLEALISRCGKWGGAGVVIAHSGVVIGVIADPSNPDYRKHRRALIADIEALYGKPTEIFHSLSHPEDREVLSGQRIGRDGLGVQRHASVFQS